MAVTESVSHVDNHRLVPIDIVDVEGGQRKRKRGRPTPCSSASTVGARRTSVTLSLIAFFAAFFGIGFIDDEDDEPDITKGFLCSVLYNLSLPATYAVYQFL